jgi:hypothetical protein
MTANGYISTLKMSKQDYDNLFTDAQKVVPVLVSTGHFDTIMDRPTARAWSVYHKINDDRSYSDDHPLFVSGRWTRIIPFAGQSAYYFYDQEGGGLNDDHIQSAMLRIMENLSS